MTRTALAVATALALVVAACSSDAAESEPTIDQDVIDAIQDLGDDDQLIVIGEEIDRQIAECSAGTSDGECANLDEVPIPTLQPQETTSDSVVFPEGFSTVLVEITEADGTVCELCMWLADSSDERGQGLMGVTSLGTPEGMVFVWEQPTAGAFFMFQTVTPLSIAWFGAGDADGGGALVSTADMEPCLSENSADCERFAAGGEYVLAVEVFQGDLASIGITDGATARLLPDTEATDCPLR